MIGTSTGAVLDGIEATVVHVEADVGPGIPQFSIVGLPDSAVSESKLRIRSAIRNSGLEFPNRRITVNLSPASMRKRGAGLDLAIAVAILRADGQLPPPESQPECPRLAFCAELSLSGQLIPVDAMVNLALALRGGVSGVIVSDQQRCVALPDLRWYAFSSLAELFRRLQHPGTMPPPLERLEPPAAATVREESDFAEVIGL
ncbi:MAG: hypothetical protein K6T30_06630 [Alicyclobacillus sp.]|nr:hypothetical protein [Alicyclobacillus sp.]